MVRRAGDGVDGGVPMTVACPHCGGGAVAVRADLATADPEALLSDAVELCRRVWKREDESGEIDGEMLLSLTDTLSRFNEWRRANPRAARDLEGYTAIAGATGESLPDGY